MKHLALYLIAALAVPSCQQAECAHGDYDTAECRAAAGAFYARITLANGSEVRFVGPDGGPGDGLLQLDDDGTLRARPAGLGDFTLAVSPGGSGSVPVILENVAADTVVLLDDAPIPPSPDGSLLRRFDLPLDGAAQLVGARPCPDVFELAAGGDIQTNPVHFQRILESMALRVPADGVPLLGLLLLGDLAEDPDEEQFRRIRELLRRAPVPVAVTAGNHDVHGDRYGAFNRFFGPGNHAFDVCGAHVALLDTGGGDLADSVEGQLGSLLDPGDAPWSIAGMHYPPWPERTGAGWGDEDQAFYVLAEAARLRTDLLLAGHVHTFIDAPAVPVGDRQVHQVISGTLGADQGAGTPIYGYTRVRFGAGPPSMCFEAVAEPGRTGRPDALRAVPWCD